MEERYQRGNDDDANGLPDKYIAIDEFIDFVHGWPDSLASPIFRYFGELRPRFNLPCWMFAQSFSRVSCIFRRRMAGLPKF